MSYWTDNALDVSAVLAIALFAWFAFEGGEQRRHERDLAERYATVIAACANGESFNIGNRIVLCAVTDVKP